MEPDYVFRSSNGTPFQLDDGSVLVGFQACSTEALMAEIADGVAIMQRLGGSVAIQSARQPTDIPGEAITTGAFVRWIPHPGAEVGSERVVQLPELAPSVEPLLPLEEPAAVSDEALVTVPADEEGEDLSAIPESER